MAHGRAEQNGESAVWPQGSEAAASSRQGLGCPGSSGRPNPASTDPVRGCFSHRAACGKRQEVRESTMCFRRENLSEVLY